MSFLTQDTDELIHNATNHPHENVFGALGSAEPLTTAPAPVAQAGRSANPQGAASAQPGFSF